jgi:hypothetical protein
MIQSLSSGLVSVAVSVAGVGLDGHGGTRRDPAAGGLAAWLLAHPVSTRLHAR